MDEMTPPTGTTALATVPDRRGCTRCHGEQHLIGGEQGMGKFRCDHCELAIGFDLEGEPVEFLISRGLPGRYTKDIFGSQLLGSERRLS